MEKTFQKLAHGTTNLFVLVTSLCIFEISLRKGSFEWVIKSRIKMNLIIKSELRVLNLSHLDGFMLVSLIDALPTQWRESLKYCISTSDVPFNLHDEIKLRLGGQIVLLEQAYWKIVYKELRNRNVIPPSAKLKFNAHFVNDTLNWKKKISLALSCCLGYKDLRISL